MEDRKRIRARPKVDVHTHYGEMPCVGERNSLAEFRAMLREWNIKACLCSSARAVFHDMEAGNRELAEMMPDAPEVFGYVYFDPRMPAAAIREIERYAANPRFVGVKSRPDYHGQLLNSRACREILQCAKGHGFGLLLHTWGAAMAHAVAEVADEFGLPIILGHMGGGNWREVVDAALPHRNVVVEPCCTIKEPGKVDYALSRLGRERVLFGSDLTLIHPGWTIGQIESSRADEETKEFIYWRNAVRLFPKVAPLLQQ